MDTLGMNGRSFTMRGGNIITAWIDSGHATMYGGSINIDGSNLIAPGGSITLARKVPESSTLLFLGAGLIGFAGIKRK